MSELPNRPIRVRELPEADRPGRRIRDRYVLLELLGEGGMARVWRGEAIGAGKFRRDVAIKRPTPSPFPDPASVRALAEEARVAGKLVHPNIVQTFDYGLDDGGMPYLVMELVEGVSMHVWLESERPRWELVLRVVMRALAGLSAAHEQGVVHRDLSPHNIVIGRAGDVKLIDFGVASAYDGPELTPTGHLKGKLPYFAPELLEGGPPTPRSDLYAIGVLLWEALAGRPHFPRTVGEHLVRRAPPPLALVAPGVPAAVCAQVDRALGVDPRERHDSADHMRRALRTSIDEATVRSTSERIADSVAGMKPVRVDPDVDTGVHAGGVMPSELPTRRPPPLRGAGASNSGRPPTVPFELTRKKGG